MSAGNRDPAGDPTRPPADPNDPLEVWAKRVGRALSVVLFIGLVIWLLMG